MVRSSLLKLGMLEVAGIVVLLLVMLVSLATVGVGSAAEVIPYGVSVNLDGSIDTEWSNSLKKQIFLRYQRTSCSCSVSSLPTELYLLHDDEKLYVAISIRTSYLRSTRETLRAFVFLDNGDNAFWNVGDNLIILPAEDGMLLTTGLDYYYPSHSNSPIERATLDVQQNATGIGRWNPSKGTFDFEMSLPMKSGDPLDVPIEVGRPLVMQVGFDIVDPHRGSLYHGKAPSFSAFVAP